MNRLAYILLSALLLLSGCGDFMIGPGVHDFCATLPGGFRIDCTSPASVSVSGPNVSIPHTVVELANDEKFILVKQQHIEERIENSDYGWPIPGKYSYWIVDVTEPRLYGPFDDKEFAAKRLELKVDSSLTLRDVYTYDPRYGQAH